MHTFYLLNICIKFVHNIQKQPSCKISVWPPSVKSKMAAKNGCDGRLIAKILIMTIQVNLVSNHSEM